MPVWLRPSTAMAHGNTKGSKTYLSQIILAIICPSDLSSNLRVTFDFFLLQLKKGPRSSLESLNHSCQLSTWADNFQIVKKQKNYYRTESRNTRIAIWQKKSLTASNCWNLDNYLSERFCKSAHCDLTEKKKL